MNNLRIADMVDYEKPIEKLKEHGAMCLSDAELLAIILRTGSKDMSVIELAQRILNDHPHYKGLHGLNYRHLNDLMKIPGVGKTKASQIIAMTEISRRMSSERRKENIRFNNSETVADYFMEQVRYLTKERLYAVFTSTNNEYLHKVLLSEGTVDRSLISPRELFIEALKADATGIILVHNHPSGDPNPSDMDIIITKEIKKLGEELRIPLLDHIIIGNKQYISLASKNLL